MQSSCCSVPCKQLSLLFLSGGQCQVVFSFNTYIRSSFPAGPTFFWGRYLNYRKPEDFIVIENYTEYFTSMHWSSWHDWDGHVIWFFTHNTCIVMGLLLAIAILIGYVCLKFSSVQRPEMSI